MTEMQHDVDFDRSIKQLLNGAHLQTSGYPDDAPDIGLLSADAVRAQWEETAKDVESLGGDVKSLTIEIDDKLRELNESLKLLADAARHVRARGDDFRSLLERASATSKTIRGLCADVNGKVTTHTGGS